MGEARQDSRCSRLLVKCDNKPETVNMKITNEDGGSVTVATGAATVRTSQGRRIPRQYRDCEVEAEAWQRQRQFLCGPGKPMGDAYGF